MGLFSKRLTRTQEAELQGFAEALQTVREQSGQEITNMLIATKDLMAICHQAVIEDRNLLSIELLLDSNVEGSGLRKTVSHRQTDQKVNISTLMASTRKGLEAYSGALANLRSIVTSLTPANWYPKKYLKAYDYCSSYFNLLSGHANKAIDLLKPPEPLKHDPSHGNDKLNLFVYSLNSIAMFSNPRFLPEDV